MNGEVELTELVYAFFLEKTEYGRAPLKREINVSGIFAGCMSFKKHQILITVNWDLSLPAAVDLVSVFASFNCSVFAYKCSEKVYVGETCYHSYLLPTCTFMTASAIGRRSLAQFATLLGCSST